jgi:enoyl-CoA hydratase/carnithine racemase
MTLLTTRNGAVVTIALDRPSAGNRLDAETLDQLIAEFEGTARDSDPPAVVILTSTGSDFSLGRERTPGTPQDGKAIVSEFERIQRLNEAVQRCSAVTIAAVVGRAEGAGLSLAARCDIVVVADDARLSFPEIPHGIPPTIVLSHFRYVLPQSILGDLIFGGRELNGAEAVQFGLAARSVSTAAVATVAAELASRVAGYDRRSIALVKDFLARTESLPRADAPGLGIALYALEMADRAVER